MKFHRKLLLLLFALQTSCSQEKEVSSLHQDASPHDPTVKVHRIQDGSASFHVYVSKNKGYRIDCGENEEGVNRLIRGLGVSSELLASSRTLSIDSQEYESWKVAEQPRLTCQPEGKFLYKIDLQGQEKYFLTDPSISATRLYNIGCSGLIETMGFSLQDAYIIPSYLVTETKVFTAHNEDDLNCVSGFSPSSKFTWTRGKSENLTLQVGMDLPMRIFEAQKADGTYAELEARMEGVCDWVQLTPVAKSLLLGGKVPQELLSNECIVTIGEKDATDPQFSLQLKLTAERLNWERSGESDVNGDKACDGIEDCVYLQPSESTFWAKRLDHGLRNWTMATAYCDKLEYNGWNDWRLPTKDEALKAVQANIWTELKEILLNNAPSTWTSTETPEGKAWMINLSNGNGSPSSKGYVTSNAVLCVRK
ncbi:Lcl domain-containing protein [Oligoflexus tunisiensis]|uniref:Lcl domain-containing protein n=1 Tax=Oligoflexus tunisiensis TaxID=708132 RepID=UPI00114CCF6A|nr:DUF1566 domain-containing protein [Oligoflexus tunisiensis]